MFNSEEEANQFVFHMACKGAFSFSIMVPELSMLHTAEEYSEIFGHVFSRIKVGTPVHYANGYLLDFAYIETFFDAPLLCAVRTGNTAYLTAEELACYQKLLKLADTLQLRTLSPIDAVVAAHDYLVLNTAYDMEAIINGYSDPAYYAQGTILNGKAVCAGYASAFRLLMELACVPCKMAMNDDHDWNLVQIDGKWYHVDVTWDDPWPDTPGITKYQHFMMTDEEIQVLDDHYTWNFEDSEKVTCTSTKYRLYPYQNSLCTTKQEALDVLKAQQNQATITFVYPVAGKLNQSTIVDLVTDYYNSGIRYIPEQKISDSYLIVHVINPKK